MFCVLILNVDPTNVWFQDKGSQKEPSVDYTPLPWRNWTNSTGDQYIYGQFSRILERNQVVIVNEQGKEISIPIHRLSDIDIFEAIKSTKEIETESEAINVEAELVDAIQLLETPTEETELETLEEPIEFADLAFDLESNSKKEVAKTEEVKQKETKETLQTKPVVEADKRKAAKLAAIRKEQKLLAQWNKVRTWTDVSGKHTFEGKFLKIVERANVVFEE